MGSNRALLALAVLFVTLARPVEPAQVVEDFESYTAGALSGQNGWFTLSGSSSAQVYADNGPGASGGQCARLDNAAGSGIRLIRRIGNLVGTDKILNIQYDIRNLTNHSGMSPTTIRVRVLDNSNGIQYWPSIDNMHYDGGGDPGCQAQVSDGNQKNIWATGGPAWHDTGWHTVAWRLNYATRTFTGVRFDGREYPQFNYYFKYSPGYAATADALELNLTGPDGNNDVWEVDNVILTSTPVPQPIPIGTAKGLADGTAVEVQGAITAAFGGDAAPKFYVQEQTTRTGIQVRCGGYLPDLLLSAPFAGQMATDEATHERYIQMPGDWNTTGARSTRTVALTLDDLGGEAAGLQEGVHLGLGLNNVGTLVKSCGTVTGKGADNSYVYITDGSGVSDGGEYAGVRVDLSAIAAASRPYLAAGSFVIVTGISSVYEQGGSYCRTIRARSAADISVALAP